MSITVKEKLESDETKAQGLARIVNDDWPIIDEIAKKGFVVKNKKSKVNIEEASNNIHKNSVGEDSKISQQNELDNKLLQQLKKDNIKETMLNEENNIEEEKSTPRVEDFTKPKNITVEHIQTREEKITLVKQIGVGLTHLFILKATNLLKPINFVAQNFSKFFITLVHVLVPLAMALFLTQKIEFITTQLAKESTVMNLVYFGVFYVACIFMWIFIQVFSVGIFTMIKKSLYDVAKIGKEKI